MKSSLTFILLGWLLLSVCISSGASLPKAGFRIPDSIQEVTVRYKRAQHLILLPVTINDTIHLNLILDTGCRNLVLFGKRFTKLFEMHPTKVIEFSGLGSGKSVVGAISLGNKVSIDAVLGESIPLVIVPNQNLFSSYSNVDGIIGYDVFIKFEIELNTPRQTITFRPAVGAELSPDYVRLPLRVDNSRPYINASVLFPGNFNQSLELMIDTGSSLGLLLKTGNHENYLFENKRRILGRGLNGIIEGGYLIAERLFLDVLEVKNVPTGIIHSPWPQQASIGMEVLKDYSFVLNYCKGYAGLKKDLLALSNPSRKSQKPL